MSDETNEDSDATDQTEATSATGSTGTATADEAPESEPTAQAGPSGAELQDEIERRYHELEERYDELRGALEHYNESAQSFIRKHPAACIAGAVGAGYIIGRLASRRWLK